MANLTTSKLQLSRPWSDWLDVDRFFNDNFLSEFNRKMPAVNIAETEQAFQVELVAPGFTKADFTVNVEDNMLQVSGQSETETSKEEKNYSRKEYHRNSFSRSFTLPENVQDDAITAVYENGILKLTIPKKAPEVKKEGKKISVG
ncbi:hypothetical protein BC349_18120 [Flavihumibacter stibioxidans]|uniref:SHSP domain-containing protein n=2 Tax=Flavihumibacter stibioxidans TaxID=1834163 RepID=A0ABR7MD77_9BACT|nr:hypothetical protein [Flavihumibacter stibioxidans]